MFMQINTLQRKEGIGNSNTLLSAITQQSNVKRIRKKNKGTAD